MRTRTEATAYLTLIYLFSERKFQVSCTYFLYVLNSEGDIKRVPVNQMLKGFSWNKSIEKEGEMSLYGVKKSVSIVKR